VRHRILVTGAGSGAGNNLIRSLRAGAPSAVIVGCHPDRFVLKKSGADVNYLVREPGHPDFEATLRRVLAREKIDLLIPNSDGDVKAVSAFRARISSRLFLPSHALIELCQDKYELSAFLRARGVPAPLTYAVTDLTAIETLFDRLAAHRRLWCRVRAGGGSLGAIPVTRPEQARSWIAYWEEVRGVPATSFTISEYLPGRDFAVQALWRSGTLVLFKTCERLSYFGGGSQPSGVSSTPALGKLVFDARVVDVCRAAIHALDPRADGVFSIDLKENSDGVPCITEINAGRFCMITNIFDLTGKHNMAATYVRLALGEPVEIRDEYDVADDHYLVRDLDTLPGIFHADELFEGIRDT
jgi:carbamoyl-phosphate synthase large subunit